MASTIPRVDNGVLGVVILARHGDRQGFYQNPSNYSVTGTSLTHLGNAQEYQLGQYLRNRYLISSSPSWIRGLNLDLADPGQIKVRADAGGEGGVIYNSAVSLLQGLYPSTTTYNTTLANGTTIATSLIGYQQIPIESVEPDRDVSLEGWTSCNTFKNSTEKFYKSEAFRAKAAESKDFLDQLSPYLDGRPVSLENMWNVYDYMNVQSIHNATFAKALPPTFLEQARHLANFHEYGVFTAPDPRNVGNVAGLFLLQSIADAVGLISNNTGPKMVYMAVSYKPLISLFNLTGAAQLSPSLEGIPNYASALAFEVRSSITGDPVVRLNFKNGTDDDFHAYNMLGSSDDIPLANFTSSMYSLSLWSNSLPAWCQLCQNFEDRGCGAVFQWRNYIDRSPISKVGAGFLGAGLTLAIALAMILMLVFSGCLALHPRKSRKPKTLHSDTESISSTEKSP